MLNRINWESIVFEDLKVIVAVTKNGILEIAINSGDAGFELAMKKRYPDYEIVNGETPLIVRLVSRLRKYFARKNCDFDLPLDLRVTPFQKKVLDVVAKISYGETLSYGEIAKKIGNPNAARAVGGAVGANPIPIIIPCHRVLAAGGKIGGFSCGIEVKEILLDIEGIIV